VRKLALIVNPTSTGVTRRRLAAVTAVLARHAELVVHETERRGHASELAALAAADADALVVFSGDGTYNEAINGAAGALPFGFVPGGGVSVFPRALGLPRDPVAAADRIGRAFEERRSVAIGLGRVNGRLFCFSAGIGFDAEAVRRVEARGRDGEGRRAGNAAFIAAIARMLVERRFHVSPQLEIVGSGRAAFLLVANGRPYTYAGSLPVVLSRQADFEAGLELVAPRIVEPASIPMLVFHGFRGTFDGDEHVIVGHDVDTLEVRCDRPLPLQADGEDLGDVTEASFEAARNALSVLI
jgi:diacylglycerol kinase family enzyme